MPPVILNLLFSGLGFIKKYWLQIIIILVVLAAVGYVWNLRSVVIKQEKQIAEITLQLKECAAANAAFDKMLGAQNEAIKKWGEVSEKQLKEFEKLPGIIAKQGGKTSADIKAILSGYKPLTCEDAMKFLLDARKEYSR